MLLSGAYHMVPKHLSILHAMICIWLIGSSSFFLSFYISSAPCGMNALQLFGGSLPSGQSTLIVKVECLMLSHLLLFYSFIFVWSKVLHNFALQSLKITSAVLSFSFSTTLLLSEDLILC